MPAGPHPRLISDWDVLLRLLLSLCMGLPNVLVRPERERGETPSHLWVRIDEWVQETKLLLAGRQQLVVDQADDRSKAWCGGAGAAYGNGVPVVDHLHPGCAAQKSRCRWKGRRRVSARGHGFVLPLSPMLRLTVICSAETTR